MKKEITKENFELEQLVIKSIYNLSKSTNDFLEEYIKEHGHDESFIAYSKQFLHDGYLNALLSIMEIINDYLEEVQLQ